MATIEAATFSGAVTGATMGVDPRFVTVSGTPGQPLVPGQRYFLVVHAIESHIVGPRIVGHAVGLHPIISISALIAGAELFGILGALFVAPVVGVIQAIIVSIWREWRTIHPEQFPKKNLMIESNVSDASSASSEPAQAAVEPT